MTEEMDNIAERVDEQARQMLIELLQEKSMAQIAKEQGFNRGLIPYVLDGGHSPTLLEAFDMPVYERRPVPVCMTCGHVHTMHKLCVEERKPRKRYRKSAELNSEEDPDILEAIAKFNGMNSWTELCQRFIEISKDTKAWTGTRTSGDLPLFILWIPEA
jgi:hypothetical protein